MTVVDDLENGHAAAVPPGFPLEVLATDNMSGLTDIFAAVAPVAVVDFAAYLIVSESQTEPEEYLRNNVRNFRHVLDAMVATGVRYIVKSTTQATYGNADVSLMPLNETFNALHSPWTFNSSQLQSGNWSGHALDGPALFDSFVDAYEASVADAPWLRLTAAERARLYFPLSIYGVSKLLDEVMLSKYEARHGIRYVALRYGNVCGADPRGRVGESKNKPSTLMTMAIYSLMGHDGEGPHALKLYGDDYDTPDGTTVRDYVHPSDLARAHAAALRRLLSGLPSDTYNLGTGHGSSVLEVLDAVSNASGRTVQTVPAPRRAGDPPLSVLDIAKAQRALGYTPQHDLASMAATAWHWHYELNETFPSERLVVRAASAATTLLATATAQSSRAECGREASGMRVCHSFEYFDA